MSNYDIHHHSMMNTKEALVTNLTLEAKWMEVFAESSQSRSGAFTRLRQNCLPAKVSFRMEAHVNVPHVFDKQYEQGNS